MERSAFFPGVNIPVVSLMPLTFFRLTPGRTAMVLFTAPSSLLVSDSGGNEREGATLAVGAVLRLDSHVVPSSGSDVRPRVRSFGGVTP